MPQMCNPCLRTGVTHVPGPYMGEREARASEGRTDPPSPPTGERAWGVRTGDMGYTRTGTWVTHLRHACS